MRLRNPYVGDGADGARRSAAIDRSEAELFDSGDPRIGERLASATDWDAQAEFLETAAQHPDAPQ